MKGVSLSLFHGHRRRRRIRAVDEADDAHPRSQTGQPGGLVLVGGSPKGPWGTIQRLIGLTEIASDGHAPPSSPPAHFLIYIKNPSRTCGQTVQYRLYSTVRGRWIPRAPGLAVGRWPLAVAGWRGCKPSFDGGVKSTPDASPEFEDHPQAEEISRGCTWAPLQRDSVPRFPYCK